MFLGYDGTVRLGPCNRVLAQSGSGRFGFGAKARRKRTSQGLRIAAGTKTRCSPVTTLCRKGQTLIFTRTKRGTEQLAKELVRDGFAAAMIHGDRSQSQRHGALSGFQEGRFQVLVATDFASRGLHVDDVAHVINYDVPKWRKTLSIASAAQAEQGYRGEPRPWLQGARCWNYAGLSALSS